MSCPRDLLIFVYLPSFSQLSLPLFLLFLRALHPSVATAISSLLYFAPRPIAFPESLGSYAKVESESMVLRLPAHPFIPSFLLFRFLRVADHDHWYLYLP